jgi:hypothetical protein
MFDNLPVQDPLIVTPLTKPWAEMVGRRVAVAARRRERECIVLVGDDAACSIAVVAGVRRSFLNRFGVVQLGHPTISTQRTRR